MKKYLIITAIAGAIIAVIWGQHSRIQQLKVDKSRYKNNTEVLLSDLNRYRTKDSLNVAMVDELQLKMSEYKRFRQEDAELIKTLQLNNRDLERITTMQTETIHELRGSMKDSIVYIPGDTITKVLKCIDIRDEWIDLHGCVDEGGQFIGSLRCRDSLVVVESGKRGRFLGFLWRTKKVKNRNISIVSKNPNTDILGIEYISLVR